MLMAVYHSEATGWTKVEDLDQLSELRAQAGNVLWAEADVASLTDGDVKTIADEFELHELAVEDAIHTRQRPKFEAYEGHLFGVFHQLDEEDGQFEARQIACFIGERWVVALHDGATRVLDIAKKRFASDRRSFESPSFLVHTMVDVVVDDYQVKADALEAEIEEMEEIVLATPSAPVQRQLYSIKQRVARLRRYVVPGTRALERLLDPAHGRPFSEETTQLFRDVHDHLMRMTDQIKNVDDLSDAVLDLVRGEQANTLNETTRKLTAWAAIFAIDTLIAGIYGMNFSLVPPTGSRLGFWFALALTVVISVGLYAFFKNKKWL